jgi:hypothetical protein
VIRSRSDTPAGARSPAASPSSSHMSPSFRLRRAAPVALALLTFAAACSDHRVVGPSATREVFPSLPSAALGLIPQYTTFTVNPTRDAQYGIEGGVHKIVFPAASICDPATSSYGPTEWDKPCTPAAQTVTITAKSYRDLLGRPVVEFSPALRFVPDKQVVLYMNSAQLIEDPRAQILYCPDDAPCIDESRTDASLGTSRDGKTIFFSRRIKHFSGYMVGASRTDEAPQDTTQLLQ